MYFGIQDGDVIEFKFDVSKPQLVTLLVVTVVAIAATLQIPPHHPSRLEAAVGIARLIGLLSVVVFWAVSRVAQSGRR